MHYIDVGGIPVDEAAGLETLVRGLQAQHPDDDALLAAACPCSTPSTPLESARMTTHRARRRAPAPCASARRSRFWLKLGFISFGGPAGQIALMHQELVERRRWISEQRFLHALNYCMLLPGPEAQQLATYIGWLMHRTWGGIVAGGLFVLPSLFILIALSWIYMALRRRAGWSPGCSTASSRR